MAPTPESGTLNLAPGGKGMRLETDYIVQKENIAVMQSMDSHTKNLEVHSDPGLAHARLTEPTTPHVRTPSGSNPGPTAPSR